MKKLVFLLSFLVLTCLFMGGCVAKPPTPQTTPLITAITSTIPPTKETTVESSTEADFSQHLVLPSGLTIDQYELIKPPELEPLTFKPVMGSQDEILSIHAGERNDRFPDNSTFEKGVFTRKMSLKEQDLIAQQIFSKAQNSDHEKASVEVTFGQKIIYTIDAGDASPLTPLEGLWTFNSHWVLEVAVVNAIENTKENSVTDNVNGSVVMDGEPLNEKVGYQETFGFQLINDKPFYFFKKDDKIGISYDGQDTLLGYDHIPHYGCCSGAEENPRQARNMVSFFAQEKDTWYYVEIGVFK